MVISIQGWIRMSTKKHHIVFIRVVPEVFWILSGALYWHWHRSAPTPAVRQNGHIIGVIPYNWQAVYYPPYVVPDYIPPLLQKIHKTYTLYCWFGFECNVSLLMKIIIIMSENVLTHWGRVTHICVSKLTIIGSDNGLSPGRRQAIIWTNAGILLIRTLEQT